MSSTEDMFPLEIGIILAGPLKARHRGLMVQAVNDEELLRHT